MVPFRPSGGRRFYLNAAFDLELGGFPTAKVHRSTAEMSVLFLPLLTSSDTIVLDVAIGQEYLDYLHRQGLLYSPRVQTAGLRGVDNGCYGEDVVWGWNDAVVATLGTSLQTARPETGVVRMANGRQFCTHLATTGGFGVPGSQFYRTVEEFTAAGDGQLLPYPLVMKPAFGSSGFGLLVVESEQMVSQYVQQLQRYTAHGGFVVEPWCSRTSDLVTVLIINENGAIGQLYQHQQWVNRYGAFFGISIEPGDPVLHRWEKRLSEMVHHYAAGIAKEGYFGPVGIDSFVYNNGMGEPLLAAGIEINARYTMGFVAHQIRKKLAPEKHFLLRFAGRKKCCLPEQYPGLYKELGEAAFDPERKEGIVLCTPLRAAYGGEWRQPQLSVFAVAASSKLQLEEFDRIIRQIGNMEHTR